jgi:hypothetical protein
MLEHSDSNITQFGLKEIGSASLSGPTSLRRSDSEELEQFDRVRYESLALRI